QVHRASADAGKNSAKERWNRGAFFANKIRGGNIVMNKPGVNNTDSLPVQKHLETQHWLELIDSKHRYGSNRLNYLVKIDDTGKLRWARNNKLVDTTPGHWKDSGNGGGIVPEDMPARPVQRRGSFEAVISPSSSVHSDAVMHYLGPPKGKSKTRWSKAFYRYFTVRGVTNRLLRTTLKRNTWLYASVSHDNIFIGIKRWNDSYIIPFIWSLSHFHRFIDELTERGVDMNKVKISKAEAALWG
ncbi:hypothetical protein EV368DRAFT_29319, partial [Lentinula lateritia]